MRSADRIIIAPRVVTMTDVENATHIAISGDRIVAVGGPELIDENPGAEQVKYTESTILPGLTDSHIHPVWGLEIARGVDLTDVSPLTAVAELLRTEAESGVDVVFGWGLDPNVFVDGLDGSLLDDATLDIPMFLRMRDVHSALVNSAALKKYGITGKEAFADESHVDVDSNGEPTGYLKELSAMALVLDRVPSETTDALAQRLLSLLHGMAASGLTSAHVMDFAAGSAEILIRAEELGELPLRLRFSPMVHPGSDNAVLDEILALQGQAGRGWHIEGVKFMVDGTVDNGTAWLEHPDLFGESTKSIWTDPERYVAALRFFAERGVPTATHAIGDRAVRFVLEALAKVDPDLRSRAPHRVEHIETIPDELVEEFAALGIVASMQPVHATHHTLADGSDNWSVRLGEQRRARGWRCRDLRDIGVPLALGSDWPVTPYDPKSMMADSVLRRPVERPRMQPVQPKQGLTMRMALEGYTTHAAIAEGRLAEAGCIAPGYRADLTVLSLDPLTATPEELAEAAVQATYVRGNRQHLIKAL